MPSGNQLCLKAFDIVEPDNPEEIGYYYETPNRIYDLSVANPYVFLSVLNTGVDAYEHMLFTDIAVDEIVIPTPGDSLQLDTIIIPQVQLTNNGNTRGISDIFLTIGSFYANSKSDTLIPYTPAIISFSPCTLATIGWQTIICSSYCNLDTIPTNNILIDSIYVCENPGIADSTYAHMFSFSLFQNYPNPVTRNTNIVYSLAHKSCMDISIYDASGKKVVVLLHEEQQPGNYCINLDLQDISMNQLPNGVYFYQIRAGDFVETKKMLIIR